jgi:membrane fusion protein (multidrug efflux system)
VGGYVAAVGAAENAHVPSNAELVRLDAREYAVRLAQADAELAAALAAAGGRGVEGQARTVVRTASNQRDVGTAQVEAARAQRAKA